MNRSAYLTTGLAIKALSSLSKADIEVHGKENLPQGPTIFVMNHFTRVETFLLPYQIYNLTGKPAWSLAAASLFKGGLQKFFDLVGVVSTSDPKRDELIVKSLLTGEANWIIFPEGAMVKTKKIIDGGKYMIAHPDGMRAPRTGAAALGLRAELYRSFLHESAGKTSLLENSLKNLGLESLEQIVDQEITITPVNLTYYPIRAAENIALDVASRLVKDIPERMVEEIMTEGTMLLSGVDLDIRFGKPIKIKQYLSPEWTELELENSGIAGYSVSGELKNRMRQVAFKLMQRYMGEIYSMTTVNQEHLFASIMRLYPFAKIEEQDFKRRAFYVSSLVGGGKKGLEHLFLHKSLKEDQAHLLTDDRYKKYENFVRLAEEKEVVEKYQHYLIRDREKLSAPLGFHKGRIDNPIEVMANEVEPLGKLQSLLKMISWQPCWLLKLTLTRYLIHREKSIYQRECEAFDKNATAGPNCSGMPFLLRAIRRKVGIVLIHSYLAVPEEVKALASYLRKQGVWVYAPRLPGHGTTAEDLAEKKYRAWIEAVEVGYVLMRALCDKVIVGGVSVGGNLAFDLASRVREVDGVFAVCPPYSLKNYSTNFMPATDVWHRMVNRLKAGGRKTEYLEFSHGNSHVNYTINPVAGIKEVGELLDSIEYRYSQVEQPALVIQADRNPVVTPDGSKKLFDFLGSRNKEFCLLSYDRHVLVNGEGKQRVFNEIHKFIKQTVDGKNG